jgi:hypothetical protein
MAQNMIDVNIFGVKSTLEYLRRFEPDAFKAVQKQMRTTAQPVVKQVRGQFPANPGVVRSNGVRQWAIYGHDKKKKQRSPRGESGYTFPRYDITEVRRGVKAKVGGRKNKSTNSYPILRIIQDDGAGQIFDLAAEGHSNAGRKFVGMLPGSSSRVMWRSVKRWMPSVRKDIEQTLKIVEKQYSDRIMVDMDKRAKLSASSARQVRDALGRFGKLVR